MRVFESSVSPPDTVVRAVGVSLQGNTAGRGSSVKSVEEDVN